MKQNEQSPAQLLKDIYQTNVQGNTYLAKITDNTAKLLEKLFQGGGEKTKLSDLILAGYAHSQFEGGRGSGNSKGGRGGGGSGSGGSGGGRGGRGGGGGEEEPSTKRKVRRIAPQEPFTVEAAPMPNTGRTIRGIGNTRNWGPFDEGGKGIAGRHRWLGLHNEQQRKHTLALQKIYDDGVRARNRTALADTWKDNPSTAAKASQMAKATALYRDAKAGKGLGLFGKVGSLKGVGTKAAVAGAIIAATVTAGQAVLDTVMPGQAFVGNNIQAWQQSVKTGLDAQKDFSTWAIYNPLSALFKGNW